MAELEPHWAYLQAEWRAARAAPLSRRKAILVAALIDAYVDRLFAASADAGDILQFRAAVAEESPALAQIMALCSQRPGVALVTEAEVVPIAAYGALPVEDFMVSLYNDHSVQRLRLTTAEGGRRAMQEVLEEAMAALSAI